MRGINDLHNHSYTENHPMSTTSRKASETGETARVRSSKFEVFGTSNPALRTSGRAFRACLALRANESRD